MKVFEPRIPAKASHVSRSGQPNVEEYQKDRQEEEQPHTPADSRALRHTEHTVHVAADTNASIIKGVIQRLGQAGAIADFITDGDGQLTLTLAVGSINTAVGEQNIHL